MTGQTIEPECCPKFDPEPWDGKTAEWKDKRFIKDHVTTAFFTLFDFGAAMNRMIGRVEEARNVFRYLIH